MNPKRIDILIPAYNEDAAIGAVLRGIPKANLRRVVVVDNASSDQTAAVALAEGAEVVACAQRGYGAACLAGLAYLRQDPPDVVVFLDGDHADDASLFPDLVAPILVGQMDFVLSSRALGIAEPGSLTLTQRFGNRLATSLMRWFWGTRFSDLGPFRAIDWIALESLAMADQNFGWTIEMQIKAHLAGLRIMELPVNYRCRIGVSKISGTLSGVVRAGYKILFTVFKYRWLTLGRKTQVSSTRIL